MDAYRLFFLSIAACWLITASAAAPPLSQLDPDDLAVLLTADEEAVATHELPAWDEESVAPLSQEPAVALARVIIDDRAAATTGDTLPGPDEDIATLLEAEQQLNDPPVQALASDLPPKADDSPKALTIDQLERAASGRRTDHGLSRLIVLAEQAAQSIDGDANAGRRLTRLRTWALNTRGELRSARGDAKAALADFEDAIAISPDATLARHNRAISLAESGRHTEALADFDRVIATQPSWTEARRNRAALHLSQDRVAEALADCDAAIASAPALGADGDAATRAILHLRGSIYKQLGRTDDALADFDDAILGAPADVAIAQTHVERASLYLESGDYDAATDDCFAALHADPRNAEAYRGLAWLLAAHPDAGRRDAALAIESAERARRLLGDTPETLEAAAVALAASGQPREAQRLQIEAIRLGGSEAGVEDRRVRLAAYAAGEGWTLAEPQAADQGVVHASHDHR